MANNVDLDQLASCKCRAHLGSAGLGLKHRHNDDEGTGFHQQLVFQNLRELCGFIMKLRIFTLCTKFTVKWAVCLSKKPASEMHLIFKHFYNL